jgi:hypothetical protein
MRPEIKRRPRESFSFFWRGMRATLEGRMSEVSLSNSRVATDADMAARDTVVVCSIGLQCGVHVETLGSALLRDSRADPSGPLGAALNRIARMDGGGRC